LIGWCFANAANAISADSVGAFRKYGGDAPNICQRIGKTGISTTVTAYALMEDMDLKFISSGRPVRLTLNAPLYLVTPSTQSAFAAIFVDNVEIISGDVLVAADGADEYGTLPLSINWRGNLSIGTHTIQAKWMTEGGFTLQQKGNRVLIAEEL
jgi:hypothetical protein